MSPTREHLLGYLLGALDRAEQEQVEAELEVNPALRDELRRLDSSIDRLGLTAEPEHFEPPAGLAARTCRYVAVRSEPVILRRATLAPLGEYAPRRFAWTDLIVAAAVVLVAASLFFPALAHSRSQAQIAGCQNNLRYQWLALAQHTESNQDRSFPLAEADGNRSNAGIVPVHLVQRKLVPSDRVFLCPAAWRKWLEEPYCVPTYDEVDAAVDAVLEALQERMGGDFGYAMGYIHNGQLQPVCNTQRSHYPIVSDAPSPAMPGRQSANHGRGQNVLYEDGHIEFVVDVTVLVDDPFHNLDGEVAAGLMCDDAVLGASSDRPLPLISIGGLQR
jgi:hypothetical protein